MKRPSPWRTATLVLLGAGVAASVTFAHWPALSARALNFDDGQYLFENPLVQNPSWASAGRFCREVLEPSTVHGYYQPLTMISLMLDRAVAGGSDDLRVFHRTSLALHVANTLLIMSLLYALFGRPWVAAGAALLFGVHPMTVECIPWIAERKTLLAALFALMSLLAYVRYARHGGYTPYLASATLYVLALMSKPTSTPLPVMFLLMDFWPLNRLSRRAVTEKIPLFAIGCLFAVITIVSQGRTASIEMPGERSLRSTPLIVFHDTTFYLRKMLWPTHLTSLYPIPQPLSLSNPAILAAALGTCLLVGGLLLSLRRTRALLTGWLIFMVGLFPTMGVIGFTIVLTSDKYAHLPAVGCLLILAWLLDRLGGDVAGGRAAWRASVVGAGVVAVAATLIVGTRQYLREWQTSERHGLYMLSLAPDSAYAHFQYGNALKDGGKHEQAVSCYDKAIELGPGLATAYYNRGLIFIDRGEYGRAERDFTRVIGLRPAFATAHWNRAKAFQGLGKLDGAISDYSRAIELGAGSAAVYYGRGMAFQGKGDLDQAMKDYARAIELEPGYAQAYNARGVACLQAGDRDQAIRDCSRAIELAPDYAEAHYNRALARSAKGDRDGAIADYTRAIEIRPDYAKAYSNRANAWNAKGDHDRAISDHTRAIELMPGSPQAYIGRGAAFRDKGDYERALTDYTKAIELKPDYAHAYHNRAAVYCRLKAYDRAWADVKRCRQLGGSLSPDFIRELTEASGRAE